MSRLRRGSKQGCSVVRWLLGGFLATLSAASACAAEPVTLLVRSVGALPAAGVVAYIGDNALPLEVTALDLPTLRNKTSAQIAGELCGLLQAGYLDALDRKNPGVSIPRDVPLPDPFTLKWPACVRVQGPVAYEVQDGDTFTWIRLRFTGESANGPGLKAYFEGSGATYAQRRSLPLGTHLTLPYETFRTPIRVPAGLDGPFTTELRKRGGREVAVTYPAMKAGRIITPYEGLSKTQSTFGTCVSAGDADYPYRASAVEGALTWLKSRFPLQPATVAVIDNGFFGVPCNTDGCPPTTESHLVYVDDRFPGSVFAGAAFYKGANNELGPILANTKLVPLNYPKEDPQNVAVDEISGHGTHIAGLVLGGPRFAQGRKLLVEKGESRLQISIFAIAQGTEELPAGAEASLRAYISTVRSPAVANLSLVFDTFGDNELRKVVSLAITENPDDLLFVAAAGNAGVPLTTDRYIPAALGGPRADNVLTVASVDADGMLSKFSNRGAERVDIAAPGCRISSWIDGESEAVPLSGTSQAAAEASFAAGLLAATYQYHPARYIKNRLIISGDLLADADSRRAVASMSKLNIAKALFWPMDFVHATYKGREVTWLGLIKERFNGVECDGTGRVDFDLVRAIKPLGAKVVILQGERLGEIRACEGVVRPTIGDGAENQLSFVPQWEVVGDQVLPATDTTAVQIPASGLIEVIRAL